MALVLFYTSLVLIIAMLAMKYFDVHIVRHEVISNIICENDKRCHEVVGATKKVVSKIKLKNFHRFTVAVAHIIKKETIYFKRKFDSQQPKFFLKPQKTVNSNKGSVSFFLKNVSEYKDSLKNNKDTSI